MSHKEPAIDDRRTGALLRGLHRRYARARLAGAHRLDLTKQYYYGNTVESDWKPGSPMVFRNPDGSTSIECVVVEADPPNRLVHTFFFPGTDESPSRCTWTIEARGAASLLSLVHDQFDGETSTFRSVAHGWVPILSGLKTVLETGQPLEISYPAAEGVRG